MGKRLPDKLVDLLREMRAAGLSIAGLQQATGLSKDTIIRYTSPETPPERKWTDAAEDLLRELYPEGKSTEYIAIQINKLLGRTDISAHAVLVRVGQLKIVRNPGTQAKAEAIREYWRKWRAGERTNKRCPNPDADHPG